MKAREKTLVVNPNELPERIHQAINKKDFHSVLSMLKPIRRKADFWDMADRFYRTYGYNFRFEIRRNGSEEQNICLADYENSLDRMY
jgi:hypothetical protein